jgi:hypothetical protein
MLQLHDRMKADDAYQAGAPQTRTDFPPGSTWVAFTDQVSHAAMAGQYQLEQTFLVPVAAMLDGERSPLRVLERLMARPLGGTHGCSIRAGQPMRRHERRGVGRTVPAVRTSGRPSANCSG